MISRRGLLQRVVLAFAGSVLAKTPLAGWVAVGDDRVRELCAAPPITGCVTVQWDGVDVCKPGEMVVIFYQNGKKLFAGPIESTKVQHNETSSEVEISL